jgi:hypothetical protein
MGRNAREREGVVLRAVSEELTENNAIVQFDLNLIQQGQEV